MVEISKYEFGGSYSISFDTRTPSDEAIEIAGWYPNGYFWQLVAELLISTEAPTISPKVSYDCEGSAFVGLSDDSEALDVLAGLMTPIINDPESATALMAKAADIGFNLDS